MALRDLDVEKEAVLKAIDAIEKAGVMGIGQHGNFSALIPGGGAFLLIGAIWTASERMILFSWTWRAT
jgi:hypothetical protein